MECPQHKGFELRPIIADLPACETCGHDPDPVVIAYGPCRECQRTVDLNGKFVVTKKEAAALAVEEPAPVDQKPRGKGKGGAK